LNVVLWQKCALFPIENNHLTGSRRETDALVAVWHRRQPTPSSRAQRL